MSSPYALLVLALLAGLTALALYRSLSRPDGPFPPGPKPLPLLGNLFDMPISHEYKTYAKWGQEYGGVVHVSILGKHIVVLNSFDAANELLQGRSATYSDRPVVSMLHDPNLMDSSWSFAVKHYSPEWRRQRRLFSQYLNPSALQAHIETQTSSAHSLLRMILRTPEGFAAHFKHSVAEAILAIVYGYQVQPIHDPLTGLAKYAIATIGQGAFPARFLVNAFPWLKYVPAWVPGTGFKNMAEKARQAELRLMTMPFDDAKRRVSEGIAQPSFVTSALADPSPTFLITDIQTVAATMYGAGADTTSSTIHSCILGLILHPAVQVRAQAELDAVLGPATSSTTRLPSLSDRPHLPYIEAIVKESLRWLPAGPLGIPHAPTKDDVYRGWRIPKGAIIIANSWPMLHDEKTYANPFEFRPERFLGENPEPDPGSRGCFGFGRRECPGSHLVQASLWIQLASLLAVFTFLPAKDENGRDVDVRYACEPVSGFVLHAQDFPCTITPRSKEAEMRIRETDLGEKW